MLAIRARIPDDWPLYDGPLTCLTCHTAGDSPVYNPGNPNFLRGGPYGGRNDMCWICHDREELAGFNPHMHGRAGDPAPQALPAAPPELIDTLARLEGQLANVAERQAFVERLLEERQDGREESEKGRARPVT